MPRAVATCCLLLLGLSLGCGTPARRDPAAVAAAYAAAGRYDAAAREVDLAVRSHPNDVPLRLRAADFHSQAGQVQQAIDHLEIVVNRLAPRETAAWVQLADLERQRENVTDAYVAYRRAAELAPDEIRAVSGLALTADSLGFDDEARAAYTRWAELERRIERRGTPPANTP
jgi:tetratricopeptide (TPR) repeat protein